MIVSGVGRLRASIATAVLASSQPLLGLINLGLCGSPGELEVGRLAIAHRVIDHATSRSYYPDMLGRHGLPEVTLETFERPVTADHPVSSGTAVDMEGAGFFEAASCFLSPARIQCLKVVSDHLEGERFSKAYASGLIEGNLEALERVLKLFRGIWSPAAALAPGEETLLAELGEWLKLSFTQRCQLRELALIYKVQTGGGLDRLECLRGLPVASKRDAREALGRVRELLESTDGGR